jgi:hypothetical protein
MTTTSDARKRLAEATDPHAACKPGRCEAGDRWRSVSCAGGGGDVEAAAESVTLPVEADWSWDQCAVCGSVEVTDRRWVVLLMKSPTIARAGWCAAAECQKDLSITERTIPAAALAAQPAAPQPTEGGAGQATESQAVLVMHYVEGWLSNDYPEAAKYLREHADEMADQMVEDDCAVEDPQRPEGVTVTEWSTQIAHSQRGYLERDQAERRAAHDGSPVVWRNVTTFPDVVTEWTEVSGDTEAGDQS